MDERRDSGMSEKRDDRQGMSNPQPRYRAYNMHGPTVYGDNDLREVCKDAKRASRGTGGMWRVRDTQTDEWLAAYDGGKVLGLDLNEHEGLGVRG